MHGGGDRDLERFRDREYSLRLGNGRIYGTPDWAEPPYVIPRIWSRARQGIINGIANTSYLRYTVEPWVRGRLAEQYGQPFTSRMLRLAPGGTHEFDACLAGRPDCGFNQGE